MPGATRVAQSEIALFEDRHLLCGTRQSGLRLERSGRQMLNSLLAKYQTDFYRPLNRALRGVEQLTTADLLMAEKIDSAIEGSSIRRDMIVYRGFRRDVVNELEPGDIFTDKGFSSCSLSETVVRDRFAYGGGTIFLFVARKGTRAIYLDDLLKFPKPELEILFPRGTSFRVLSKENRRGISYLMVELISRSRTFRENKLLKQTSRRNINSLQLNSNRSPTKRADQGKCTLMVGGCGISFAYC